MLFSFVLLPSLWAWFPRAQTLQWARPGLGQMPLLRGRVCSFSSPCGTPGNRQVDRLRGDAGDSLQQSKNHILIFSFLFLCPFFLIPLPLCTSDVELLETGLPSFCLSGSLAVWYWASHPTFQNMFLDLLKRIKMCANNQPTKNAMAKKKKKKGITVPSS